MSPPAPHTVRQVALAAATALALRPLTGPRSRIGTGLGTFAVGWLTADFAPQLLTASLADTALTVARRRATWPGLALSAATTVGLGLVLRAAHRTLAPLIETTGLDAAPRLTLAQAARPLRMRDRAVRVDKNIAYGPHGWRNRLDIYRRADGEVHGAPVLIQIHGGAWTLGSKEEQGRLLMNEMAARGWVCVAINYRLSPTHRWPTHLNDVNAALAWVQREISAYGGDPHHVVLTGGSAGGHLCSLAALRATPGHIAACVPFYGVFDLLGTDDDPATTAMRTRFLARRVFAPGASTSDFRDASPLHQIHPEAPDFLVLHGSHDTLVPVRQAHAFVRRLREVSGSRVDYVELPGTQHAFDIIGTRRAHHTVAAVAHWLERHYAATR